MSFRSQQSFRLLVGDPSLRHTKPSCLFFFLAKLFIPFSIFDKSLHSFCLPTYKQPATHLLSPSHPPIHTPAIYLPTYIHPHAHPTTYLHSPTSTQLLSTYLPPPKYPSTYLPPSTQLQPLINLHTCLSTNPTRIFPPTYPPTCLHTTYLHKYLPLPTHLHFYLLTYLPTNQLTYLTTFLPTYLQPPTYLHPPPIHHIQLPIFQPTYLPPPTPPHTHLPTYLPPPIHLPI